SANTKQQPVTGRTITVSDGSDALWCLARMLASRATTFVPKPATVSDRQMRSGMGRLREARVRPMTRIAIEHGLVLTMDAESRVIADGRVIVDGRDIAAVESSDGSPVRDCDVVIDASGKIVLPGLVNAHTHLCMVFGRTIGPERRLLEWLDLLMPMMAAMDDDALYVAELLGCVENIKNGNTCLVENIFMPPREDSDP